MLEATVLKIKAAATVFANRNGCSAQELADTLNIPLGTVYKYAKTAVWTETLDALDYTGDRTFNRDATRNVTRDAGDLVAQAHAIYIEHRQTGATHKKAVSAVCAALGLKRRRINDWAKKLGWGKVIDEN